MSAELPTMNTTKRLDISLEYRHKKQGDGPDSLFKLCLKYVVHHLETICFETVKGFQLHEGLVLPNSICEPLIETYQREGYEFNNKFAHLFKDIARTNLKSLRICQSKLTDDGLEYLFQHKIIKIELIKCPKITDRAYTDLFKRYTSLRSIIILPDMEAHFHPCCEPSDSLGYSQGTIARKTPDLKKLILKCVECPENSTYNVSLERILEDVTQLRELTLIRCYDVQSMDYLCKLTNLQTLVLHGVEFLNNKDAVKNLCSLKSLVVLDISFVHTKRYRNGNKILGEIMKKLPNLMSLDISKTNLAGTGRVTNSKFKTDIPGLDCRIDNPLEFLGLFGTLYEACDRPNIPAKRISGHTNVQLLINSAATSMDKHIYLIEILSEFNNLVEKGDLRQVDKIIDIVLEILFRRFYDTEIQKNGLDLIYSIMRILDQNNDVGLLHHSTFTRRIVMVSLNAMHNHKSEQEIICKSCLTLGQLNIRHLMFEFNNLLKTLLRFVSCPFYTANNHGFKLLVALMSKAKNELKIELCENGIIETMIEEIKDYFLGRHFEDVLQVAWFSIRSVTDGAPKYYERFINSRGMEYLIRCLKSFPNKIAMKLNILTFLCNIAQVRKHRPKLLQIVEQNREFFNLLYLTHDEVEVGYSIVEFFVYLVSDGNEAWVIKTPRNRILLQLTKTMQSWNLDSDRKFHYCSFRPLLQLAQIRHTPQCAYFAVWMLANLTKKYPEKYCSILKAEGGLRIMTELIRLAITGSSIPKVIYVLAVKVIRQCELYP